MNARALFIALAVSGSLTACTTTVHRINEVSVGMAKAQVLDALGHPASTIAADKVEILKYKFRRTRYPLKFPVTEEYHVRLVNGQVQAFGQPRDLPPIADDRPVVVVEAPKNEKTININVRTEGSTNAVAPIQPKLELKED